MESLGGPAGDQEIARYVHAHFNKELAAKQDLLEAAAAPAGARIPRLPPDSLDLLGGEADADDHGGTGDDDITRARPGPSRAALEVADGTVKKPSGRREAVTIPMQAGVARLASEPEPARPDDEGPRPVGEGVGAAREARPGGTTRDRAAERAGENNVPQPIEPAPTESIRRPVRWRTTPPWLPALALAFAAACGLAALLYYVLSQ